ncbi:MAG: hypothetical protein HYV03_03265 [Deltaproteobacteria bacterium]|nr:hypothetical protein [Deltaproteobacteria bacterium]
MLIRPQQYKLGATLAQFDGQLVGAIGAFSRACVDDAVLAQPLEVLLVEGSAGTGFHARLGDAAHRLYEGRLTEAEVSFTLEAFHMEGNGDPLPLLLKDSACCQYPVTGELRGTILDLAAKEGLRGALLYVTGTARDLHTYGHTDPRHLNDQTKTFAVEPGLTEIEGWGNLSFIDGKTPFVHVHGTYVAHGVRKGGHFIMDDRTPLHVERTTLVIYPVRSLIRTIQGEDFPTWQQG